MMSAWAASDPLRHPWFTHPSLKRKHSESSDEDTGRNSDSDQEAILSYYPTPPPNSTGCVDNDEYVERKRRRCDTIERRMARMYIDGRNMDQANAGYTLNQTWNAPLISTAQPTVSNASYAYTAGSTSPVSHCDLLPQYAVEEPVSPDMKVGPSFSSEPIIEVRMKGAEPSWYEREKDRIVITDLDEAVEEAEQEEYKSEAEPHPDAADHADSNADYSISSVLLDHIKKQANFPYVPKSSREENGGALVLFRPPPLPFFSFPSSGENTRKDEEDGGVRVEEIDENEAITFTPTGSFTVGTVSSVEREPEVVEVGEPMDMDMDVEM